MHFFLLLFLPPSKLQLQMEISYMVYQVTSDRRKQKSAQLVAGSQCQLQREAVPQTRFPHVLDQVAYLEQYCSFAPHNSLTQRHILDQIRLVSFDQPRTWGYTCPHPCWKQKSCNLQQGCTTFCSRPGLRLPSSVGCPNLERGSSAGTRRISRRAGRSCHISKASWGNIRHVLEAQFLARNKEIN